MSLLVTTQDFDRIRELRLNRAPVNAITPEVCEQLGNAIRQSIEDGIDGIVLTGQGNVFSAGLDIPYLLSLETSDDVRDAWMKFIDAAYAIASSPIPIVSAINGHSPAGGCVWALCCDYRIMVKGAYRIGLNETQVGLIAPEGIQRLMRRVIGTHRASNLLITGSLITADEALTYGLVDELVDDAQQSVARAREWLHSILQLPRNPMLATRAIARVEVRECFRAEFLDLDTFVAAWNDADTQRGLKAIAEKLGKA